MKKKHIARFLLTVMLCVTATALLPLPIAAGGK